MDLHARALKIVARYKRVEAELLEVLQGIEAEKIFLRLGYGSLFEYTVKALGLSEGAAYNFVNVARKAKEVPELREAIAAGSLTVSKARKITSVLTRENKDEWLLKASSLPKEALEREVARVAPMSAVRERAKYIDEKRLGLNFSVSEELYKKLRRVQDLESKRQKKPVSLEDALEAMAETYLHKKDPLVCAERNRNKTAQQFPGTVLVQPKTRAIPQAIKHQVYLRDKGRCQYKNCTNSRFTEIHHIQPIAYGGTHALENLQTLCSAHHRLIHSQ